MKRDFDFYEFVGVIAPGMVVTVGGALIVSPTYDQIKQFADISAGGLGVLFTLSYVVGQLVQALGNVIEKVWWWLWSGMPSDWPRSGAHQLISDIQRESLQQRVRQMFGKDDFEIGPSIDAKEWFPITRQIYAAVAANGKASRIDVFNGNYGFNRGIAASMLTLLVMMLIAHGLAYKIELTLLALTGIALYRMHRFGVHYGRELFVQFLQVELKNERKAV